MLSVKRIVSKQIWENYLKNCRQVSFLQSWNWGEFNQSLGNEIFRLGFYQKKILKGVALVIKKKAKRGIYLECPAGPLIDWQDEYFRIFINEIKSIAEKEKAVFIRVRPNILDSQANRQLFKNQQFIKAPMHLHAETTWVLDLDESEQELLKKMRKNTRYSIKKAQKIGVKVEKSIDKKDITLLYDLQMEAVKRHKFVPFSKQYFLKQLESFKKDDQIQLFKAVYQGKTLAISFIIFYGDEAVYHYSGSSNQLRQVPASYLLQWQAIREAKKRHLSVYNFWGIAKTDNPNHRFYGVTLFKKGFGGKRIDYLPAQDLPLKTSYWLNYLLESFRRQFRHLSN